MKMTIPVLLASLIAIAGCSESARPIAGSTPTATPSATATPAVTMAPAATTSPSPLPTASPIADASAQLRDLEARMDSIFADTFRGVGDWFNQKTGATSVDLREQTDKYIARLYLPKGADATVDAKVEHGVLRISTESKDETAIRRHEQLITLGKRVVADKVNVAKKDDVVVVSVPKVAASAPAVAAATLAPAATSSPSGDSPDRADGMLARMDQMQARLDETIRQVFQHDTAAGASTPQLGSAMNIENQDDKYVVHFFLPEKKLSDVQVKFENNQLHLTAQEQNKSDAAAGDMESRTVTRYETMTALPGPVKDAAMQVERKEGSVIVTLPKA